MGDAAAALREATQALGETSDSPRLDAELLLAHALQIERADLLLKLPELTAPAAFSALVERRRQSEPVAHIIGKKEFWGLDFQVTPDVLIPRPDSELLIEEAVRAFAARQPQKILDLGTGSGALVLAALSEFPGASGVGIDASAAALQIAHNNADALGLADRTRFLLIDWKTPDWTDSPGSGFDLILANPPYVSTDAILSRDVAGFEPHQALFAGKDGLADYRIIMPALAKLLSPTGLALLEIGFDQANPVSEIATANGYHVELKQDLGGNDRLLILRR
ncbi:peptide chain release factor N(5)-glutamine methyltransferase [Parasphingorhabdus flavimaris]|jgi:release factor glutamine methyltransferase|uniref:Release factor glutamine methyltransferase n=1 Tax=Parasphingorhabdus flavimaris TaxID=266812 RepID=A0ABX2N5V3_9SPHN|nr:peptide chain release factor N(5)-glutamine methyltransferase [Parasphingorhabdus flavimaris]NVD29064.1 peptide chain release factor N(5)-glutamine methyltransferase [Parasphingorhabdus flavimaris]|tara:strand:- start:12153 stop:12989 length:837 start_codon:yes stop_codon:yes gene_type:complete